MSKEVGTLIHNSTRAADTVGTPAEAIPGLESTGLADQWV